ncbi:MAG: hypothetical protein EXR95_10085 [Gemmatimonadetes bacterium]|nr:hypothetical protein [Gemmatimonadota bacterium]
MDAIILPSSSAAEALVAGGLTVPAGMTLFAIGPATAATARRVGLPVARVPRGSGVDGLVAELGECLNSGWVADPLAGVMRAIASGSSK